MKEPVRKTKHPYLVGVVVVAIAAAYFSLVADNSKFPEPGASLEYDIDDILALDNVETRYEEIRQIKPNLELPRAMEVDAAGNLLVAGKGAVALFNSVGAETARFAVDGDPTCLEFMPDGRLLVGFTDHVDVLDSNWKTTATWGNFADRMHITSMAADEENVFLADYANRVVFRVDHEGNVINKIGEMDEARDVPGLEVPSPNFDVAFDSEGTLWVVNPGKQGMESYRANGDIITSWYRSSSIELKGFSGCCNPAQIAFNNQGRLVTCEKGPVRVKVYEVTAGEFEELVVGSSAFHVPQTVRDMVVDASDQIMVLDPRTNMVRVFGIKETTVASNKSSR